jgi:hypothetical protein
LGLVVTWVLVPKMKNQTPMEIDRMFEMELKAREFIRWEDGGADEEEGRGRKREREEPLFLSVKQER